MRAIEFNLFSPAPSSVTKDLRLHKDQGRTLKLLLLRQLSHIQLYKSEYFRGSSYLHL